jgi:uncharacterized protein YchJ
VAHRTYRLSISPEGTREIRRVVDFDGRASLDDVHQVILDTLIPDDGDDHLYVFFMSGKYWDKASEYVDPRTDGPRADRALLFRLNLKVGQRFVYVFDYGDEQRHELTVTGITDVAMPLEEPVLVESVGAPPAARYLDEGDEEDNGDEADDASDLATLSDDALAPLVVLAERVMAARESSPLAEIDITEKLTPEQRELIRTGLRQTGAAALELAAALGGSLVTLGQLLAWFGDSELVNDLVALPSALSEHGEVDLALAVAEAYFFVARETLSGDMAVILARAGRRDEALARVAQNLETAEDAFLAEGKAGDAYRALGEWDAAEAYYRRSLAVAEDRSDRSHAALRIASLLIDTEREADANAFLTEERRQLQAGRSSASSAPMRAVGRNDPCPCGSGKKYKKCHGASA